MDVNVQEQSVVVDEPADVLVVLNQTSDREGPTLNRGRGLAVVVRLYEMKDGGNSDSARATHPL
jgi:hypothetical protein